MDNRNYITVAEYARIKGITRQRVYQLLNKSLQKFVKEVDNKKVIDISALSEFELTALEQGLESNLNQFEQDLTKTCKEPVKPLDRELEQLQADNDRLQAEITRLQQQVDAKDQQIADYAIRFADMAAQAQQIAGQAQYLQLHSATDTKSIEQDSQKIQNGTLDNDAPNQDITTATKKGFFAWLHKHW